MPPFDVGTVILGKFKITRVIGEGGMGIVLEARHLELNEPVAIKVLQPAIRPTEAARARFELEARLATKIESKHVARVFDHGEIDGTPFIVMEYLRGRDLAAELRERGPLPVEQAVDWLLEACEAIAEAHALGIVHRDLKPANLFLATENDEPPCVKVLDFGVSKMVGGEDASVTASHALVGSPRYMAPEQLSDSKAVDRRADVWALGVILYELVTGKPPFPGRTIVDVSKSILQGMYTRPSLLRKGVPVEIDKALEAALKRSPDKRLPNVVELAAALAACGTEAALASLERIEQFEERAPAAPEPASKAESKAKATLPRTTHVSATGDAATPSAGHALPPRAARGRRLAMGAIGALVAGGIAVVAVVRAQSIHATTTTTATPAPSQTSPPPTDSPTVPSSTLPLPLPPASTQQDALSPAPVCPPDDSGVPNRCVNCRNLNCCAPYLACEASDDCRAYKACIVACRDKACVLECDGKLRDGHAVRARLAACAQENCLGECSDGNSANPCVSCQFAHCRKQAVACYGDADCDTLYTCASRYSDQDDAHRQKCLKAAPEAAGELLIALNACRDTWCYSECRK